MSDQIHRPLQQLLLGLFILVQLFAPLVHAHAGGQAESPGLHLHIPSGERLASSLADLRASNPAPGLEVGLSNSHRKPDQARLQTEQPAVASRAIVPAGTGDLSPPCLVQAMHLPAAEPFPFCVIRAPPRSS